jgi:hypothetical protein
LWPNSDVKDKEKYKLHRILNLENACYHGCETWSLLLMEEHKLRVFGNRVLRKIIGPKRDEATGDGRKVRKTS